MFDSIDASLFEWVLTLVSCWLLVSWAVRQTTDPELETLKANLERLEDTQLEMEQINGVYYLWAVFPDEGHKFIGQSDSKDDLARQGIDYLKKRFVPS